MLLFLLTAREGRLSANRFGCSVIAQFPRRAYVRPGPAPPHPCVSRSRPASIPTTKSAILRVFYIGTNSREGKLHSAIGSPQDMRFRAYLRVGESGSQLGRHVAIQ
jgi:hypothetical protein